MTGRATVTFSCPDVKPPVYLHTSLNNWERLEMAVSTNESGRQVFTRHFDNVPESAYQYKMYVGDEWILDRSKEIGSDGSGNLNNIGYAEHNFDEAVAHPTIDAPSAPNAVDTAGPSSAFSVSGPSALSALIKEKRWGWVAGPLPTPSNDPSTSAMHAGSHNAVSNLGEFAHAPLMSHETGDNMANTPSEDIGDFANHLSYDESEADDIHELGRSPRMPHEIDMRTNGNARGDNGHVHDREIPFSCGTTLVDEYENGGQGIQFAQSPRVRYDPDEWSFEEGDDSIRNSVSSEEIFPFETSSIYSDDANELDRVLTLPHEQIAYVNEYSNLAPRVSRMFGIPHRRERDAEATGSNDGGNLSELDRAPKMLHESASPLSSQGSDAGELDRAPTMSYETAFGSTSQDSSVGELERVPTMSHEPGYSSESDNVSRSGVSSQRCNTDPTATDTASERSRTRRIMSGEENHLTVIKSDSFTSEILRQNARDSIFGTTRRPTFGENESILDEVSLLPHERITIQVSNEQSGSETSSGGESYRPRAPDFSEFVQTFTGRTNPQFLDPHRSRLPHSLPRSDDEDQNLRDSSLEIFPVERNELVGRLRDIGRRLSEDIGVPSTVNVDSPVFSTRSCSSVELAPIRSSASLQSIREDADEDSDGGQDSQLPSPVLELAPRGTTSRQPPPPYEAIHEDQLVTPMRHRHPLVIGQCNNAHNEEDETRRYGRVFDTVALPPEPPVANSSAVTFSDPDQGNLNPDTDKRPRTPYPYTTSKDYHHGIFKKMYTHFRSCLSRPAK
ncbi:hypothetical protein N0V90_007741 [Kalmusia sp. IMI 367209]|nr:hypothetical protein N0V90_007741 [Kalmusia sp. IMI 367209]